MKKIFFSILALSVFISGCASTQKMSSTDRQNLTNVKISTEVEKAPEMYYLGPGIGMFFGAIGGAITAISQGPAKNSLQAFAEDNNIHIEQIVLEEANKAFKQSGKLSIIENQNIHSTSLNIEVSQYGFSIPNGFSSKLVPIVRIKCSLVDTLGKTIWSSNDYVTTLGNPAEASSMDELKNNPKLIEDSWRVASKTILANIVKNL